MQHKQISNWVKSITVQCGYR